MSSDLDALEDQKQFHAGFFDEARDHVRVLERRLLELETRPTDLELLNALFRAAHSIKGSSAMLGFDTISRLTHAMENVLDQLRELRLTVDHALTGLLLEATDTLAACTEAASSDQPAPDISRVVQALDAKRGAPSDHPSTAGGAIAAAPSPTIERQWEVLFRPRPEAFGFGIHPALTLRELMALGRGKAHLLVDQLPPFEALDPETCRVGWRVELWTTAPEAAIREVFLFVEDMCELQLRATQAAAEPTGAVPASTPVSAQIEPSRSGGETSTLRVGTEKVDRLVNLVGELVISQAMIARGLAHFTPAELPRLRDAVAEMERHTRELQDGVMNIRMVPIGSIFGRFRRLARDLSGALGKEIELITVGEDTELDKSMVERLADPLTHLVRNAADHGLESTADRLAAGKSRAGHVTLCARHQGGSVVVDVGDDGRGLNTQRIRAKAVERGLIREDSALSDEQIHELIFAPGFSTAGSVTDLSGRGVGMDVVKRSVEELNGTVTVHNSPGQGARVRLTMPLTLAILEGMAVRVGKATYVFPLNQVVETISINQRNGIRRMAEAEVLLIRSETIPLLRMGQLFSMSDDGAANKRPLAIVLEAGESKFAVLVDELLGKSQYVIKSLEPNFQKLDGLLGATILGDGTVSLIVDALALARLGHVRSTEERESVRRSA